MRRRPAYTLLEVLLSLAIAVLLFGALYTVVGYQLKHAQAGRDLVDEATLARVVLQRMGRDVLGTVSLNDPARFRPPKQSGRGSGGAGGGGAAAPAAATPAAGTPSTASAPSAPSTGSAPSGAATGATATDAAAPPAGNVVQLPLGVIGDANSLTLYVSRVPGEVMPRNPDEEGQFTSDLRRISYWLGSEGGLCRWEALVVTTEDATAPEMPAGEEEKYLLAAEVKSLEFQYFDGTSWVDSWDSTTVGDDGKTPQGSPRAISIRIGVARPGASTNGGEPELKYYRHVVAIPTAGGTPTQPTEGATAP